MKIVCPCCRELATLKKSTVGATWKYPATLFTCVGVLWRTRYITIVAFLFLYYANKWPSILEFSRKPVCTGKKINFILPQYYYQPRLWGVTKTQTSDLRPRNSDPENSEPSKFKKKLNYSQFLITLFYGHTMFIGNSQKEARYLSSPVYRCRINQAVKN